MNVLSSFLASKSFRIALLAGVGITAVGIVYSYFRRRRSSFVVQDIEESYEPGHDLKCRLKGLLRRDNVFCTDIDYVEEVIDSLILGGSDDLQVIADFDRTMTPLTYDGKPVPSCHCVIENSPRLPEWFLAKLTKIKDYYLAIELDPQLTREEKLPFMEEWWEKAHDLLLSTSITRTDVAESVSISNLYLREGSSQILELLHKMDIPLLVFSAGIGDIISQMFIQRYRLYDNMHIIANWMEFNHEGGLIGFKGENIHIFNKNTHAIENASYFNTIRQRHNIILLGDSLGDLDIADGVIIKENILTIGYLNYHIDASLPEYMKRYDIVLTEEDGVELIQSLLDNITASSSS